MDQTALQEFTAESPDALTDEYGFAYETAALYSDAPLEFEEIAFTLWEVVNELHQNTTTFNRLSPFYALGMQSLERQIRQMGSYCITQSVLEQSGLTFPKLSGVNIPELYRMVCFHFRKCRQAFEDEREKGQDIEMMQWLFRWAALSEQLKTTQNKIERIRKGELKTDELLAAAKSWQDRKPENSPQGSALKPRPALRTAGALPIKRSFAQEIVKQKKITEKKEQAEQRAAERAADRVHNSGFDLPGPFSAPSIFRPDYNLLNPQIPGTGMRAKELRKLMTDEALSRKDKSAAKTIAREDPEQLYDRFQKLLQEGRLWKAGDPPPKDPDPGPSADTRKKLREKRKKRK